MTLNEYYSLYQEAARGNNDTLIALYRKAADEGDASAMGIVACLYFLNKRIDSDQETMVPFLQKSLDADNPFGCYCYGCMLADGIGVQKDRQQAKKELIYAAKAGHPRAMYVLGMLHYWDQEFEQSYHWLYRADENGNTDGEYILGLHFNNGWGCIMDKKAAFRHFSNAANKEKDAAAMLSVYYYLGESVPEDKGKAIMYASLYAELSGDKELMELSKSQDYGDWMLMMGKIFQRVNINNKTLLRVFSESAKFGNREAAEIVSSLEPIVKNEEDDAKLKEMIDDVKEDWKDLAEDILKNGLGLSD